MTHPTALTRAGRAGAVRTAFRSAHPDVLGAWQRAMDGLDEWTERMVDAEERLGRQLFCLYRDFRRQVHVVGIEHRPDENIPAGWHLHSSQHYLIPESPEAISLIASLAAPAPIERALERFGVQSFHHADEEIFFPGVQRLGDALYVTWATDTGWDGGSCFEPIRVSAYYAALEASSDQQG